MIRSVPLSRATLTIAITTPECTVPSSTSTLSRCTSLFALSVALDGSDSSSTVKYSIARPAEHAAVFLDREIEALRDRRAERREGSRVRQHHADSDLGVLCARDCWRKPADCGCRCEKSCLLDELTPVCHVLLLRGF
jgi:hypothetical protein